MFRLLNRLMELYGDDSGVAAAEGVDAAGGKRPAAALLRGLEGALAGRTVSLPEAPSGRPAGYLIVRLGRGPDNDLSFPGDTTLNPRHAALYRVNGQWYCRDLDSTNGTLVGTKLLRGQSTPVAPGTEIRLGRQRVALQYEPSGIAAADAARATTPTSSRPRVSPPASAGTPVDIVPSRPTAKPAAAARRAATAATETAATSPWRWVPPGESVTVREWTLPGGMLYVGRKLPNLQGYGTEPSLINPALKVGVGEASRRDALRSYSPYAYSYWGLTYADASPGMRQLYLDWLAGGRRAPNVLEPLLLLFFYGIERRLIAEDTAIPPPEAAERDLLRAEVERLKALYPSHLSFQRYAASLLSHLDARRLIEDENAPPPDVDALLAEPEEWRGALPWTLEIALARIARDKKPLDADLAYVWVRRDPDAPSPRTVVQRCPDQLRRLWNLRYRREHPKGMRVPQRKTPLRLLYRPASPGLYNWSGPTAPGGLHQPGQSPLRTLRLLLFACCDELDPFSRFVGKRPELRDSPLAAGLLPIDLRSEEPAMQHLAARFAEWLPADSANGLSLPPPPRLLPGAELLRLLTSTTAAAAAPELESLTRSESLQAAALLEGIGIGLEPDARRGGPPLEARESVALGRLPAGDAAGVVGDTAAERDRALRPACHLLAAVLRDAMGERAETSAADSLAAMAAHAAEGLAAALGQGEPTRYALLLAWLLADGERIRPPRQTTAFADLSREQCARLGALLVETALRAAGGPASAVAPPLVRRLSAAYRVLRLDETFLYEQLHHGAAAPPPSALRPADSDGLTTIQPAAEGDAYAVPPPHPLPAAARATAAPVRLDAEAIRRKEAETAQVGRLLHDIFAEPESGSAPPPPAPAAPDVPATSPADATVPEPISATGDGPLDAAHRTLLAALLERDEWSGDDYAAAARAHGLLPGAALETINEAAWALADEPALEGSDPVYVNPEAARIVLEGA